MPPRGNGKLAKFFMAFLIDKGIFVGRAMKGPPGYGSFLALQAAPLGRQVGQVPFRAA